MGMSWRVMSWLSTSVLPESKRDQGYDRGCRGMVIVVMDIVGHVSISGSPQMPEGQRSGLQHGCSMELNLCAN